MQRFALSTTLLSFALLTACNAADRAAAPAAQSAQAPAIPTTQASAETVGPFSVATVARFDEPWAFSFLPDGRVLVSERPGKLKLVDVASGRVGEVTGVPEVVYGGQGGFGDVVPHPQFADNGLVYVSYAEKGDGDTAGAAVARAKLVTDNAVGGRLENLG